VVLYSLIQQDANNTAIGDAALPSNSTGCFNTAIGCQALFSNQSGCFNTAIGYRALCCNTSGYHNTAIGWGALCSNTSGRDNTAIGRNALPSNQTGCYNTAIGNHALCFNTSGCLNTAIGHTALRANTTGCYNTAIGHNALLYNTIGCNNIAFGKNAGLCFSGSFSNNIAIGFEAGPSTLTEESNKLYIAFGSGTPLIKGDFAAKTVNISGSLTATSLTGSILGTATNAVSSSFASTASFVNPLRQTVQITGSLGVTGSINNLLIGTGGGNIPSNISIGATTNFSSSNTGTHNIAIGCSTLSINTTGSHNTAIGYNTLKYNTTGCYNTAIGNFALYYNITGINNTAIGNSALQNNTTGTNNTAIGSAALIYNTTGFNNTAIGSGSLQNNTTGTNNTAIGSLALYTNTIGSNNIAFGQNAGCLFSGSSSNNIAIGFGAGPSANTVESNKLYIASGSGTPLIKGDFASKTVNISGSLTATSFTGSLLGTASPAGSTTEIQYNNAGALAGTSTLTFDGTTITANPITATGYFIPANALGSLSTVGADYTISNPGVYRFTGMDSGGLRYINFPNPASKADGQTIIIINADITYAGYYDQTYNIQDPSGTAITTIAAGSADTFVNMEGIWIRTSRRP
jgi:trimeric autotransporter adhesin